MQYLPSLGKETLQNGSAARSAQRPPPTCSRGPGCPPAVALSLWPLCPVRFTSGPGQSSAVSWCPGNERWWQGAGALPRPPAPSGCAAVLLPPSCGRREATSGRPAGLLPRPVTSPHSRPSSSRPHRSDRRAGPGSGEKVRARCAELVPAEVRSLGARVTVSRPPGAAPGTRRAEPSARRTLQDTRGENG